ncbi:MAG: hypothetical protein OJF59_000711 [Cytophagales bacterium]|jgi:hypothetical protein|nr:hypothetical protein [Bacteroidota bacterium]MBS1979703.1 hypothetical protein [Bacteroidota bacterium]WHZ06958.1 MAG: hypothetical protein OJF59_000711 [Cytophagales bacterium]
MNKLIFALLSLGFSAHAQIVTNVRAFDENGTVIVLYDLFTNKQLSREFYIRLFVSSDDGKTYSQILDADGDVDKYIKAGSNKQINWPGKNMEGKGMSFKVVVAQSFILSDKSNFEMISLTRQGNDILMVFEIDSQSDRNFLAVNFILTNLKNESNKIATIKNNVLEGSKNKRTRHQIILKNVPPEFDSLASIEFTLSENHLVFYNINIEK